jgi:CRISPR-associated protein Cmr2
MSKQYLLLFSISPVQSFIAQARKTQDLYAGSRILTELCRRGLQQATNFHQAEAIFPFDFSDKVKSLPNRFLVRVASDDIKKMGNNIEVVVRAYWKEEICADVIKFDESRKQSNGTKGIAQQIENHLEVHWVFQEIKDTEGGYAFAFKELDYLMSAVKNLRILSQFDYQGQVGEMGRKCSIDGERNVKFYRLTEQEQSDKKREIDNKNAQSIFENKLFSNSTEVFVDNNGIFKLSELQPGEGLSAVSMAKRLSQFDDDYKEIFRSTADIAMLYTIKYLFCFDDIDLVKKVCQYRAVFDGIDTTIFNAQLYYEENLTENYFKKQGYSTLNLRLESLREDRKSIEKKSKESNYPFLKYYALINFDGDNMGKWMNGDKEKVKDGFDLEDFHRKLSKQLSEFAKKAKKIVDSYGQTVYAGGDDFLGFLNLNYLFKAMKELRNEYDTIVNIPLKEFRQEEQDFTFSAGVCIAHYKEPLSVVLNNASLAQKTAKNEDKFWRKP